MQQMTGGCPECYRLREETIDVTPVAGVWMERFVPGFSAVMRTPEAYEFWSLVTTLMHADSQAGKKFSGAFRIRYFERHPIGRGLSLVWKTVRTNTYFRPGSTFIGRTKDFTVGVLRWVEYVAGQPVARHQ